MTRLEKLARDLKRAGARLSRSEGRVARRNARHEALAVLAKARTAIDEDFPVIPKEVTQRKKRRTPNERYIAMVRSGNFKEVHGTTLARIAAAGIRPQIFPGPAITGAGPRTIVPTWAADIAQFFPGKLARARHDIIERKAVLTEIELTKKQDTSS